MKLCTRSLRTRCLLLLCSALVLSACAPGSGLRQSPSGGTAFLKQQIDEILRDPVLAGSRAGVKVVSLQTGEVLYEKNSHLLFHPASNMKLLTSATALQNLGLAYRFRTLLCADTAAIHDSTLAGNLYLKGFGDPDLKTDDLRWLVQQLQERGIKEITGDLVCDESFLDDYYFGKGWNWDDASSRYFPPISALTVNRNCVTVKVKPGKAPGDTVVVSLEPETSYVKIENTAVTVDSSDSTRLQNFKVERKWRQGENTIVVEGGLVAESQPREVVLEVVDAARYVGTLFSELLAASDIDFSGRVVKDTLPDTSLVLAEHFSQPLPALLRTMNKPSYNNLYAELLLKTLGAELYGEPGTARKGLTAIKRLLAETGTDTTAIYLADGSGVSRYNLISADVIIRLLRFMYDTFPTRAEFISSLPIAGTDGTLANRMRGTPAEGKVRAKTGTLRGVSALSGYTTTGDGEVLAFSMLMQHYIAPAAKVRPVQDRICARLAALRR